MGVRKTALSDGRILSAAAFVCSAAVLIAAAVATFALSAGASESLRAPFLLMCHGQLERAFSMAGVAMPLCARCVGIYAGVAAGAVVMFLAPPAQRSRALFLLGMSLVIPLAIDGTLQLFGFWSTGNIARAATGVAFGLGLVILAINGVAGSRGAGSATPASA